VTPKKTSILLNIRSVVADARDEDRGRRRISRRVHFLGTKASGLLAIKVSIVAIRMGHRTYNIALADRAGSSTGGKPRGDAFGVEFVATRQTHHPTLSVDILFKANNTLHLSTSILASP